MADAARARHPLEMPFSVHQRDLLRRRRTRLDVHDVRALERFAHQDPNALRPLRMTLTGLVVHVAAVENDAGSHMIWWGSRAPSPFRLAHRPAATRTLLTLSI